MTANAVQQKAEKDLTAELKNLKEEIDDLAKGLDLPEGLKEELRDIPREVKNPKEIKKLGEAKKRIDELIDETTDPHELESLHRIGKLVDEVIKKVKIGLVTDKWKQVTHTSSDIQELMKHPDQLNRLTHQLVDVTETPAEVNQTAKLMQVPLQKIENYQIVQQAKAPTRPTILKAKPAPKDLGCSSKLLIGVRGSGERATGAKGQTVNDNLGEVVLPQLAKAMGFKVPSGSVHGFPYSAPNAMTFGSDVVYRKYEKGVEGVKDFLGLPVDKRDSSMSLETEDAARNLVERLLLQAESCGKKQRIVLAGYSQGAVIIRLALAELEKREQARDADAKKALDIIKGVATFGDPTWMGPPFSDRIGKIALAQCAPNDPVCVNIADAKGFKRAAASCAIAGAPDEKPKKREDEDSARHASRSLKSVAAAFCPHLYYAKEGEHYLEKAKKHLEDRLR